ncbi:MAG: UbiA family prenyltransferase [Flavobacteriales bacterium]
MADAPVTRNPIAALIRILRPANVVMVALGCIAVRHGLIVPFGAPARSVESFWLATAALAMMAAGGNAINDYFDVREDHINKPRLALVGTVISRRAALAAHLSTTLIGLGCAALVAWREKTPGFLLLAGVLAFVLGLYSPLFKRGFLRGNVIMALAVGVLPVWTAWGPDLLRTEIASQIAVYACLSAWITFLREVVKDLQDREGDAAAGYSTLPVVWGPNSTLRLLTLLFTLTWIPLLGVAISAGGMKGWCAAFLLPFLGAHWTLHTGNIRATSAWLKATLGGGLLAAACAAA